MAGGRGSPRRYDIFVSYRRTESAHSERLVDWLDRDLVFKDNVCLSPGDQFEEHIQLAIESCQVCLVVIGPGWLNARDAATGQRRLDDPNDVLRREVATAIACNKVLVPVLVEGAAMPPAAELPPDLQPLVDWQAYTLRNDSLRADTRRLMAQIDRLVPDPGGLWPSLTCALSFTLAVLALMCLQRWFAPLHSWTPDNTAGAAVIGVVFFGGWALMWRMRRWRARLTRSWTRFVDAVSGRHPEHPALPRLMVALALVLVNIGLAMLFHWLRPLLLTVETSPFCPAAATQYERERFRSGSDPHQELARRGLCWVPLDGGSYQRLRIRTGLLARHTDGQLIVSVETNPHTGEFGRIREVVVPLAHLSQEERGAKPEWELKFSNPLTSSASDFDIAFTIESALGEERGLTLYARLLARGEDLGSAHVVATIP